MEIPRFLQGVTRLWMSFSHALGRVMSFIILTILWIVAFGIYAIIWKIIRLFSSRKKPESYWIDVRNMENDLRKQF